MSDIWKRDLLPASYKGVNFYVSRHSVPIGRTKKIHELPGKDLPNVEDIRGVTRIYSFDAYVLDSNYFKIRDDLEKAFSEASSGILIHPYLGSQKVYALDGSLSEQSNEGRLARFSLNFVKYSETNATSSFLDNIARIKSIIDSYIAEAQSFFDSVYTIAQAPVDIIESLIDSVDGILNIVSTARATVNSVQEFKDRVAALKAKLTVDFMLQSEALFNDLYSIATYGTGLNENDSSIVTGDTIKLAIGEQNRILNRISSSASTDTLEGLINTIVFQQTLGSTINMIVNAEFSFAEEIESLSAPVFEFLANQEAIDSYTSELLFQIRNARFTLKNSIENKLITLGNYFDYLVQDTSKPPMIVSQELYGNTSKESEIIKNNNIGNPFFSSSKLKVLDYE